MPCRHTYPEIAANHALWTSNYGERIGLTEHQFGALSTDQKVAMLIMLMGPGPLQFLVSSNGVELGRYTAQTAQDALDACAQDAGYRTEAEWTVNRSSHLAPLMAKEMMRGRWGNLLTG